MNSNELTLFVNELERAIIEGFGSIPELQPELKAKYLQERRDALEKCDLRIDELSAELETLKSARVDIVGAIESLEAFPDQLTTNN